jgi:predicted MPP superfamily phosphohydrolase
MVLSLVILILGVIGHAVLWATLVNRAHALGIERRWIDLMTLLCGVALFSIGIAVAAVLFVVPHDEWQWARNAAWIYLAGCAVMGIVGAVQRLRFAYHPERYGAILKNHTTRINLQSETTDPLASPGVANWLSRLPGNEVFEICVQEKHVAIPRLVRQRQGLRIAHLTDFHMSGRITKAYFERVVEHVNRCEPDLIAITGDLVERNSCLDWIPDIFGRLRATGGVYYVLGNHDRHVDESHLHARLAESGLVYLGSAGHQVTIRNTPVVLAGNELPWYGPAADLSDCPTHDAAGLPLRVLLAHSPDQFEWAQKNDVDLMLAGHNHGGQIRLPLLGAILAPSKYGVRYAAGTFRAGNTVMHVSRGTGCLTPVRYNCPAEIAVLCLLSEQGG